MSYRDDIDLEFLKNISSNELLSLANILIYDKDGEIRNTEELYQKKKNDGTFYWKDVAEELQKFGGNSIINALRNTGIEYREILMEVCDKLKVSYNYKQETSFIEESLLRKIVTDTLDNMSEKEKKELLENLDIKTDKLTTISGGSMAIFQAIFKKGGFKSYQLTVSIANRLVKSLTGMIGKTTGLSLAANSTLTKSMAILTGPIGWVASGIITGIGIAGPAFRVTIPAVIQVSLLRKEYNYRMIEFQI